MPEHYSKRIGYAPWSLTREAGVQSATVNSDIEVPQVLQPVLNTGFIDDKGNWKGAKSTDEQFIGITKAEAIAPGTTVLFPDTSSHPSINMEGFQHLQFAIKASENNANVAFNGVSGPDTINVNGLEPVEANYNARFMSDGRYVDEVFDNVLNDTGESLGAADQWHIFTVLYRFIGQTNIQIKVTNNDAAPRDYEFAFRRLI